MIESIIRPTDCMNGINIYIYRNRYITILYYYKICNINDDEVAVVVSITICT